MDNKNNKPDPKAVEKLKKELSAVLVVKLTRGEINVICNILASGNYKLADAEIVRPILDTLFKLSSGNKKVITN